MWAQVEELFQAVQLQKASVKKLAVKQLAVLELKRATAIGIRMAGLKCVLFHLPSAQLLLSNGHSDAHLGNMGWLDCCRPCLSPSQGRCLACCRRIRSDCLPRTLAAP